MGLPQTRSVVSSMILFMIIPLNIFLFNIYDSQPEVEAVMWS